MKIGFISDSIKKNNTGIGNYSLEILRILSKIDCEIYLIDSQSKKFLNKFSTRKIIIKNKFPFFKTLLWHISLLHILEKRKTNFDLIINPSFFPNLIGNKKKLVFVVYDLSMFIYPKRAKLGKYILFKLLLPDTLRKSKEVITISESSLRDINKYLNISKEKIHIVYPLLSSSKIINYNKRKHKEIISKYNLPSKYYLFVGTIEPRKNISFLLQAFDSVFEETKIPLVLIGGRGWRDNSIKITLSRMKNKNNVFFTGYVSDSELAYFYKSATVFIFPSLYEGFGIPPLEAMYYGCPVITSDNSSLPEVCGNAAIYIDPMCIKSLSEAIFEVTENEDLRKKMIKKGKKQASKFNEDKMTSSLFKIIKD